MADQTVLLGIPIPSTDPVFLTIVGIHILLGMAAVTAGAVAMVSRKGRGRHARFGMLYFWMLAGVSLTMALLSVMRWAENRHLFLLGVLSFLSAWLGRAAARRSAMRLHLVAMGASYALMLTAFYVDNGKHLPLWRELPELAFWLLPAAVALPLMIHTLLRHPLLRRDRAREVVQ
jgi:uncharacterized membrane protein